MTPEEIWRRKTDEEVMAAAGRVSEYTASGQQIVEAEMQRRSLTLRSVSEDDQPRIRSSRYFVAVLACAAIVLAYGVLGALLGWKHGGGVLPMILLFVALGAAWRGITGKRKGSVKVDES